MANSLIPSGKKNLSNHDRQLPTKIVPVTFNLLDNGHYRFHFDIDDSISASMEESDNEYSQSKFNKGIIYCKNPSAIFHTRMRNGLQCRHFWKCRMSWLISIR